MSPYGRVTLKTDLNLSPSVPLSVYFGAWLGATRAVYFRVKKGGQPKKKGNMAPSRVSISSFCRPQKDEQMRCVLSTYFRKWKSKFSMCHSSYLGHR